MEISIAKRGPFAFGWVEGLGILVNPPDWDMQGWIGFCEMLRGLGEAVHRYPVGMNYAPGRGPNPEELRVHAEYVPNARLHRVRRLALITDLEATEDAQGAALEALPTRLPWRPFPLARVDDAFTWLRELSPFDVAAAHQLLEALKTVVYSPG